ncbi:carbamoyl-phosphate synthase small chain [Ligilactobacillus hayakitensis DSM 18933 = JCM 14209]|uniref:Carbamoyl phosphate synthase small chain n=1 Tax=Ligilactobacillus hayakitensis DSM 18933 = JCM 14209 TaxID=1423755 RepID=A0A0R1WT32_9LACO|nr:carbamoyl phosphate synthase small subunit [Ligilactobacillus hayakitensis]KRM19003.1 carbamoyl-phosphate synthase small chain [Ligilactobacillus hayakitensis DSM 18933 = JCM 14209]
MKRLLILEDGSIFEGEGFGSQVNSTGEVVVTTAMNGYQEIVSSPIAANQIIVFTTPVLGIYGTSNDSLESLQPVCKGVVCHSYTDSISENSTKSFSEYLSDQGIPAISGIDTRKLTKKIIKHGGIIKGSIIDANNDIQHAFDQLNATVLSDQVVDNVSTSKPYPNPDIGRNIVLIDFGVKHSVLRQLSRMSCNVTVVPYETSFKQIENLSPDGIILSNGPGNPNVLDKQVETIQELQKYYPILAIGLGHQLLALANGAEVKQLKNARRGSNFPILEIATNRLITVSEEHSYTVDPTSLDRKQVIITHTDLSRKHIEGFKSRQYPAISVQFEPEGAPGPNDAIDIFYDFMYLIDVRKDSLNAKNKGN